ncbi:MAG: fatty acid desaturase family protein [Myxococcales bacterium]|nr:fatty acid desaturase family protein [Myxococcales bacterium]
MPKRDHYDSEALEAGYAKTHRVYELVGLSLAAWTLGWLFLRVLDLPEVSAWEWVLALLLGLLAADLVSGVVHWAFDTWGSVDTPVLGRLAIRTFRHHHIDPKAITRHDFVETNGHNAMLSIALTLPGLALANDPEVPALVPLLLFTSALFVATTSQFHKWSHMDEPPKLVALLQRIGLLLSPAAHDVHHRAPHERAYCVTTGWLNGPLDRLRLFRLIERVVTRVTGAVPRRDEPESPER